MDTLDAPEWFRRNITEIRGVSLFIAVGLVELAAFIPAFFTLDLLIAVVSLLGLYIFSRAIDPMPDWEKLLSVVKQNKKKDVNEVVLHTYLSECYYDLWKWDMLLEKDEEAQMAVLTAPSSDNKTIGFVDELVQENGEYFLKRYSQVKRYDGRLQLVVMCWDKNDLRMKKYLHHVDKHRYLEIYGGA